MWVLRLNDMRTKMESLVDVCRAPTKEDLEEYMALLNVPMYHTTEATGPAASQPEKSYSKVFKAGTALEWFNPPGDVPDDGIHKIMTLEEYLNHAKNNYAMFLGNCPEITCATHPEVLN